MTNAEVNALIQSGIRVAKDLIARGMPKEQAIIAATNAVVDLAREGGGLGQGEVFKKAAQAAPVKAIRETISPWLWVLSLIGFGMGILNTRRIKKMFTDWKAKRAAKGARA